MWRLPAWCLWGGRRRSSSRSHDRPRQSEEARDPMADPQNSGSSACAASEMINGIDIVPQNGHGSNIILNHDFSGGLLHWHPNCCDAYVVSMESGTPNSIVANSGHSYAIVTKRTECWQGLEQDITKKISPGSTYIVSANVSVWGDLQGSSTVVQATLKVEYPGSPTKYLAVGRASVSKEQWENLEGTFSLYSKPKRAVLYLEGPPPGVDLLIDSVVTFPSNLKQSEMMKVVEVGLQKSLTSNIIENHDFSSDLLSWHPNCCDAYVVSPGTLNSIAANSGGYYAVVTNRMESWQSLEQDITEKVTAGLPYIVSACVRVWGALEGSTTVLATLRLEYPDSPASFLHVARASVSKEQWEKLEGTFCLPSIPKSVVLYLEGPPPGVDILVDSVSAYPSCPQLEEVKASPATNREENVVRNPNFENGLENWRGRGCKILLHDSLENGKIIPFSGKIFASATERTQSWNGIQQEITGRVQRKLAYEITAVVRIFGSADNADVRATLWVQSPNGREKYIGIANVQARENEWVQLHGKFLLNGSPSRVVIYLEGPPAGTDILVNKLVVKHAKRLRLIPPPNFENVSFGDNIVENSALSKELNSWYPMGQCTLKVSSGAPHLLPSAARESLVQHKPLSGRYILATNRTETWMGPAQTITEKLKLHLTYQVSAWVRVGPGASSTQTIGVAIDVDKQYVNGGQVEVNDNGWHELAGSFRIEKQPKEVRVYVQGPPAGVDLMIAGLQIFPVDRMRRFKHLKEQIDKVRKRDVILKFSGSHDDNLFGSVVKVRQIKNSFPFGSCINRSNIENEDFVEFFVKNFNWAVFGNELKWYHTEPERGNLNYADADEMLSFCERYGLETRGHCIFWEVEDAVQSWVRSLSRDDLMTAVQNRLTALLSRYRGRFRHYDVNNEMLHGSFYQERLGRDIWSYMFKVAHRIDPSAVLFVNDYHVEDGCDAKSSPEKYIEQVLDLQEQGAPVGGIGVQGHIDHPVGPIICSALDKLAILGLPIWFTEMDVAAGNEHLRADDLEVVLREAYAHPAVEGVVLWGFWETSMCRDHSHLVDAEGHINEAGKRYLALKKEWLSNVDGPIDVQREFRFRGFHGTYNLEITTPSKSFSRTLTLDKGESPLVIDIHL